MDEKFQTLLLLLGKDIGYMGLRVQKDMQKCLKDLRTTKDDKRFCDKLADILKKFSEFTVQYSKDLEGRIIEYQKQADFNEIIQKLQQIGGACKVCKEKGAETSNSLGPPDNNNEEESTNELTTYKLKNEVLSQCSLHIGIDDEIKSEQLTQIQLPVVQNDGPTNNDLLDTTEHHAIQENPHDSSHNAHTGVESSIVDSHNNDPISEQEDDHNDTDIANSLEISHSEEVLSNENQEEVVCVADTSDTTSMVSKDQLETEVVKKGPVEDHPVSLDKVTAENESDKIQKFDVIPLPYKPLFEKEQSVHETTKSDVSDRLQIINVIALPYKPLFATEETPAPASIGPDEDEAKSSTNSKDESKVEHKENRILTDDNDDADDEIVSIASSHEDSDSDVEIIENIIPTINVPDQSQNPTNTGKDDLPGASSEETVINEDTLPHDPGNVDSDGETEKNTSPRSVDGMGASPRSDCSVETVQFDSNVEAVAGGSKRVKDAGKMPDVVENVEGNCEWDNETIVNRTPLQGDAGKTPNVVENVEENDEWDNETIVNRTPLQGDAGKTPNVVENVEENDEWDNETIVNRTPLQGEGSPQRGYNISGIVDPDVTNVVNTIESSNDSDDTIIASPAVASSGRPVVDAKKQNNATGYMNNDSIGLAGEKGVSGIAGGSAEEKESQETITQDIAIPENQTIAQGEDAIMESYDTQKSYVFNLEKESKDTEEITQENLPEIVENEKELEGNDQNNMNTQKSFVFDIGKQLEDTEEITQENLAETVETEKELKGDDQNNRDSSESFVFDIEKEQGDDTEVSSAPVYTISDNSTPTIEGLVATTDDKNEKECNHDDREGDSLSTTESEDDTIGSDSDTDGTTSIKSKKKLKDIYRKSLLKVIADFFFKREKKKEAAKESVKMKDETEKKPVTSKGNKQLRKNTPVKSKGSAEPKNPEAKNSVRTMREKKTRASKKGERDAKEYIDFLKESRTDESGNCSAKSVKDGVQEGSSDVDNTQIDATKITLNENAGKLRQEDEGDLQSKTTVEVSKSDDENSDDSEELFKSSQKGPESSRKLPVQSISDFIAQLPLKPTVDPSEDLDASFDDPDRTQKVDDLKKLRQISKESIDNKVCIEDSTVTSGGNVGQNLQDDQLNKEENDESQVVSPFKRKVVKPLPCTQSDSEDVPNKEIESQDDDVDNQVVSPFKKKSVKRLRSSDESDSEPPKKILEADGTQESDDPIQDIVKPFKRSCVKRLLSTEDELSEATQEVTDNEESEMELSRAKRRKVKRLSSSEHSSVAESMSTGKSEREEESSGAQTETEKDQEMAEEPSQFKLDDQARDDFLNMFDKDYSSNDLEKDGAMEESVEVEREESSEDNNEVKSDEFKLGDCDRDNLLNLLTDKENEERDENSTIGRDGKLLAMINDLNDDSEKSSEDSEATAAEPYSNKSDKEASQSSQFNLNDEARDEFLDLLNGDSSDDSRQDEQQNDNSNNKRKSDSKETTLNKDDKSKESKDNEDEDLDTIEPSQFKLSSKARDEFLDLLNGEPSDDSKDRDDKEHDDSGKVRKSDSKGTTLNKDDENKDKEAKDVDTIEPSQFKLNSKARDEFLDLLNGEPSDDSKDRDDKEHDDSGKVRKSDSKETTLNKDDENKDKEAKDVDTIEPSQFKLNSKARDEFLDLLNGEPSDDARDSDDKQHDDCDKVGVGKDNKDDDVDMIEPSQFTLNSPDRDELLEMLTNEQTDGSNPNNKQNSDKENEEKNSDVTNNDTSKDENQARDKFLDMVSTDQKKIDNDDDTLNNKDGDTDTSPDQDNGNDNGEDDDDDDTENSQEINEIDESDGEENDLKDDEETAVKSLQFQLDESERDELLNLLSDHIKKTEKDSDTDSSESDEDGRRKKRSKKVKKVDKDMLMELLREFEDTVKDKVENGDMEFDNMDVGNLDAKSDCHEDSGADSDLVLMDLLREEAVDMPEEGGRRKRGRDTRKAAWNAYEQLLKDNEGVSSDDTSPEISDIDIDDLELDLSDQERRQKERAVNAELKKRFNIDKDLIIDVEQTDVSSFDLSSLSRRGGNISSKIDRLCDISNVLQKRKRREKTRRKVKLPRLSVRSSGCSDSDNDSVSSSTSHWSDESLRANRNSFVLSDDNAEQDKLANALWENIKNSSDDDTGWSSDDDKDSSSDDYDSSDEDKRKRKKDGGGEGKKGKGKKEESDGNEEDGTDDDNSSGEKNDDANDVGGESEDKEKKENKDADLDSSDEDDFVGVRKGAWKFDPLLKGCLTSDESDFESDSSLKKARTSARIKRKMKQIQGDSDGANEKSDAKKDGNKTPTNNIVSSDTDSDVEFVLEKKKTPKKLIVIDDEAEDDSPSKTGKGRRNIRALVEDDELAEATKKAKKEETERIKRLQERERAKETFSQTQLSGGQPSDDDGEPLILDVNVELQIKVHPKITKKLKPHQRSGIQFMWDSCYESVEQLKKGYEGSGCILAHCMGLGKTLQALGLIHTVFNYKQVTNAKHVLVVCPLSTVSNWRNEYKLAYKDIKHCNIQLFTIEDKKVAGQRFSIVKKWWRNGGILVMGYECFGLLTNDQKLEKMAKKIFCNKEEMLEALVNPGPDLVICDEGHLLRNKQTQRNLALNKVTTKRRIVLTGTPLQNNLLEYYYMVHFVKPNLLGTEKEFKTNFINPISNGQFEDSTAVDILFMKKRTHVLHKILNKTVQRVEDTELKRYLPELVDQALFLRLSDLQVQFYNTYLDGANARPVEYTAAGNISRKNFLGDIQILRYICTHPDVVTIAKRSVKSKIKEQDVIDDIEDAIEDKFFSKGDWFKELVPESGVKQPELGTKMMMTLGIVEEAIANNDKVLIFSQTHAEMDSLEFFLKEKLNFKKAIDYNRMDGTISPEVRTHMCDTFNDKKNKRLRVFIMSTKVGGLGLNLTAANRVIIMNVNWNPSYDTQSVFRAFRFGQNKAVYVYRLIAIDTMEEKMYQRQVTKLAVAHRVVDKHQITRHYSAADIQEFYSVRPTKEGERPLPNVPEDRVLAKLIQKFQFLYKWHEHQALLANRPEEDLNEQQKNAAWEEFNKKAVEPPPQIPGMPPSMPQFVSVSSILNQPGPSGIQNRINAGFPPHPTSTGPRGTRRRGRGRARLNQIPNPQQSLQKQFYTSYKPSETLPVLINQTPTGPRLVIETHGRIPSREISMGYGMPIPPQNIFRSASRGGHTSRTNRPAVTISLVDVNTGKQTAPIDVTRDNDEARKIQEINSLVMAQTTPELFPVIDSRRFYGHVTHASRIDEINSIISASLSQDEAVSSQEWAEDSMNNTLLTVDFPEEEREHSSNGHFADHNYSLPKTNPLTFRTSSIDDFCPIPPLKFPNIPCPLFVDVDAPLDLERPVNFFRKKKYKIYKRTIATQRVNSADDFRMPLPKYVPRPLFVDVTAPLGPRPNLSGLPSGQKNRSATTNNQPATNPAPTQVRLGSAISLTPNSGAKTNPPPAHAQKPSISIIPQPASSRTTSTVATTKPPPYVPNKNTTRVQNPLNLTKSVNNLNFNQNVAKSSSYSNKHLPSKVTNMLHKAENQVRSIVTNDSIRIKRATPPQANKIAQKIITPPPPRRVAVPRVIASAPPTPPQLNKILVPPPLSLLTARAPPTNDPLFIPMTTSSTNTSSTSTTTTTAAIPSNQQSPLQKQMRNFMEHLHQLQQKMKDTEGDGASNLGDSNNGQVWSSTGNNNKGTPTTMNNNRANNTKTHVSNSPLPPRTVVRVGPKPLSPIIGGMGASSVTRLNAARNLSNITKTYQRAKNDNVVGAIATTPSHSQSSSNRPNVRVIGTHPTPIKGTNTFAPTTRVILPNNISSIVQTDGTSPQVVRKIITNSPNGVINKTGQRHNASGTTVINPVVGQTVNGSSPRVIKRVVESNVTRGKPRVNPARINGNVDTSTMLRRENVNTRIVPGVSTPTKVTNLNRLFTKKLPPKFVSSSPQRVPVPLPLPPQRSFVNGTAMRTYETRKNTPPARTSSLPSLSLSQSGVSISKANKENRTNRKLSFGTNNTTSINGSTSIDLSNDENNGNNGPISKDMVNTLRKKGVSINYLGKDVINLD